MLRGRNLKDLIQMTDQSSGSFLEQVLHYVQIATATDHNWTLETAVHLHQQHEWNLKLGDGKNPTVLSGFILFFAQETR